MGCGVSKIDANGVATPNRILPSFPNRRRHKECKKEPLLLTQEMPDEDPGNRLSISTANLKCDIDNLSCVTSDHEGSKKIDDEKRVAKILALVQEDEKNDHARSGPCEDVEDDDDRRAISKVRVGHEENGDVFPGSPSFRVYFNDRDVENKKNDGNNKKVGVKDIIPVATTISSTKEDSVGKEEKKERKKSFRNVLPKNLLNARSSSNSSARSTHHFS